MTIRHNTEMQAIQSGRRVPVKKDMAENEIEYQMSMPDSLQQNGWTERFQQAIVNGAEAIWHHTGLSNVFWIHAVKAKLHTYNITDKMGRL